MAAITGNAVAGKLATSYVMGAMPFGALVKIFEVIGPNLSNLFGGRAWNAKKTPKLPGRFQADFGALARELAPDESRFSTQFRDLEHALAFDKQPTKGHAGYNWRALWADPRALELRRRDAASKELGAAWDRFYNGQAIVVRQERFANALLAYWDAGLALEESFDVQLRDVFAGGVDAHAAEAKAGATPARGYEPQALYLDPPQTMGAQTVGGIIDTPSALLGDRGPSALRAASGPPSSSFFFVAVLVLALLLFAVL